jgi:class 3 adenylate cyclase
VYHFVEAWRESFQEIAQFLTASRPDVVDDRVLATVLFTDIVDSTRRAAEMGDRTGARCSMRTTPSSGRSSPAFGAAR